MTEQNHRTRVHLRRLKLTLLEAIFAISDHERGGVPRDMSRAEDRCWASTLFRLRFELQDMLIQLHLIETLARRAPTVRATALISAAADAATQQLPGIRTARLAQLGAKQLAEIVLELRASLEAEASRDATSY